MVMDRRAKIDNVTRTLTLVAAVMEPPVICPHCHTPWPAWHGDTLTMSCVMCGEDWVRPLAVTG